MSESTKALNYVLNQLKQHAVGQYPMSAGRASQLINEAVKLQYPLRKVDDTFVPPSALDWVAAKVLNDAFDTQPKGCTSATPVCAPEPRVGDRVEWVSPLLEKPSTSKGVVEGFKVRNGRTWYDIMWTHEDGGTDRVSYQANNLRVIPPLPQAERGPFGNEIQQQQLNDWFTARIDPYDDRIRYLERFVHGLKAAGLGGK